MSSNSRTIISGVLSLGLIVLAVYLYQVTAAQPADDRLFFEGVFFWYLGVVFLLSRRYAENVFLMRAIDYAFTTFAIVGGRYRTLIYGLAFCAVALIQQLRWLFADKL